MWSNPCGQVTQLMGPWLSLRALVQVFSIFGVFSAVALGQEYVPRIRNVVQREHPAASTPLPFLSSQHGSGIYARFLLVGLEMPTNRCFPSVCLLIACRLR